MSEKRSCLTCELNCVCFAYISVEKVLSDCEFINKEEDVADYPEEVVSSEESIFDALANACSNHIEADDETEEFDEKILEGVEKDEDDEDEDIK